MSLYPEISSEHNNQWLHDYRFSESSREPLRRPLSFTARLLNVGNLHSTDVDDVLVHGDPLASMIFGVQREDATRSDHHMVNVRFTLSNRDTVQNLPPSFFEGR